MCGGTAGVRRAAGAGLLHSHRSRPNGQELEDIETH